MLHQHQASFDVLCSYPEQFGCLYGDSQFVARTHESYTESRDTVPISPLILAVLQGDFDTTRYIIHSGASINLAGPDGRTPLMAAVSEVAYYSSYCVDQFCDRFY